MKSSHPTPDEVVADLGDKVVDGLALAIAQTREDLRVYRQTFPAWVADATERGIKNWVHDRVFAHASRVLDAVPDVSIFDREPRREIIVGVRYRLRLKTHEMDGAVSTYPTQGALEFMLQGAPTLEGLEELRLVAGPRWLRDTSTPGSAVISLRDGLDDVKWMHDLPDPKSGIVTPVPIVPPSGPRRPAIGLRGEEKAEEGRQEER